jgi:hypothetical protein
MGLTVDLERRMKLSGPLEPQVYMEFMNLLPLMTGLGVQPPELMLAQDYCKRFIPIY